MRYPSNFNLRALLSNITSYPELETNEFMTKHTISTKTITNMLKEVGL